MVQRYGDFPKGLLPKLLPNFHKLQKIKNPSHYVMARILMILFNDSLYNLFKQISVISGVAPMRQGKVPPNPILT